MGEKEEGGTEGREEGIAAVMGLDREGNDYGGF